MAGRNRKPDELKILEGTFRRDRDGDPSTIMPGIGQARPTTLLEGEAWQMWQRLVPDLIARGLATACDSDQLTALCEWWGRYRKYSQEFDALPASADNYRLMLQVGIAHTNFDRIAGRFGLTPSDRAKIRGAAGQSKRAVPARKRAT